MQFWGFSVRSRLIFGRNFRPLLLGASLFVLAMSTVVSAQQSSVTVSVPAGPLSSALTQFAVQADVQIGFDSNVVRGKTTAGLSGAYTIEEALRQLLAGTELGFDFTDGKTVRLVKKTASGTSTLGAEGATVLQEIVLDGGSGGVINSDGYVSLSSATGAKTDTPIQETPQSVSTVTQAQLQDRNPQSLTDAIAYTPGARVDAYGTDPRYDSFFVRGFNVTNTGVFRDNLRQPVAGYGYFLTEPYGIEGISILRGPSSSLYGATGAGGLYNVISKRPTEEVLREVETQFGTDSRYQGQFDVSGPVGDNDTLLYRLTGVARSSGTDFDYIDDDVQFIAPALTWKPDEDTKLTLLGEYSHSDTGGNPAYYNDRVGHVSRWEAGDPAFNELDHSMGRFGWEFEHALTDSLTFRQNARWSSQDVTAKYAYAYSGAAHALDPTLIDRGIGYEKQGIDSFVIDNQLEARFDTGALTHTVVGGIDFTWVDYTSSSGGATIAPLDTTNPNYGAPIATPPLTSRTDQKQWQTGLYLQDQARYNAWTLTVGGRYDWVNTKTDNTDLTAGTTSTLEQKDREFSGRVGLTYQTPWGFVPYASYSTAFSPNVGWNSTTGAPFKPTTSTQQEIGVKYLAPDTNLVVTAALFNIDQENGLFYEVVGGVNTQVQRGKLRSRGVEIEAVASLDNGISMSGSYTYTDLKITKGPADTEGNYVSSVPMHMASLWMKYAIPEDFALHGLSVGAGARFQGESYGNDQNTLINNARVLFDASLSFDFAAIDPAYKGLALQVNAKNLFDRRDTTCTSNYCYLDPGRSVIGSLRYTW
ncbi:TonB-dependent siderophore receptor [Rhizobium sp. CF080]|uniref:TonB-dependent siderophore receptor n=1 Tax=Rhizobium sp. (strain CF080) TaxID=1144310 RepID=UPI0003E7E01B|nr:TonB-dependent siderophore receptor [Rhizobium sp. CF080]EUB99509.1 TonB-dependent siderophore receptor [Rhizobium sp. CF080]